MWVISNLFSCRWEGDTLWEVYFWVDLPGECSALAADSQKSSQEVRIVEKGGVGDSEDDGERVEDRGVYLLEVEAASGWGSEFHVLMHHGAERENDWRMHFGWLYGVGEDPADFDSDSLRYYSKGCAEDSGGESANPGQGLGERMRKMDGK